jgi:predicted phosphoribosyltransferase
MTMFRNREDAGRRLAKAFQGRKPHNPLVLAIRMMREYCVPRLESAK